MDDKILLDELKRILTPYVEDENLLTDVNNETQLAEDLKIDSYNIVDIILDLEDLLGVRFADKYISQFKTVGNCYRMLQQNIAVF